MRVCPHKCICVHMYVQACESLKLILVSFVSALLYLRQGLSLCPEFVGIDYLPWGSFQVLWWQAADTSDSFKKVQNLVHVYDKIWPCQFPSTWPPSNPLVLPAPLPHFMILFLRITHQIPLCIGSGDSNSKAHMCATSVLFCELSALVLEF